MKNPVILLHGLARTSNSMSKMQKALQAQGYITHNLSYPSRKYSLETLALDYVLPAIRNLISNESQPLHFVTHSMGAILLRKLAKEGLVKPARSVLLAPPNGGSEIVDKLGHYTLFKLLNGPAGGQMGTTPDSIPNQLGNMGFEAGVIAGTKSVNFLLSLLIPGLNDGKVSIESTKRAGMKDFIALPYSHPFIMRREEVVSLTIRFIENGIFK